jgi:hypothetical protein
LGPLIPSGFMNTLRQEEIDGRSYRDLRHARRHIGSFIEQVQGIPVIAAMTA